MHFQQSWKDSDQDSQTGDETVSEYKNSNYTNAQEIEAIDELENDEKKTDNVNNVLDRKHIETKEHKWSKEKKELLQNMEEVV